MSFARLSTFSLRRAARAFSAGADSRRLRAWFPPSASASPRTLAEYTVEIENVNQGALSAKTRETLGAALLTEQAFTLACEFSAIGYEPDKSRTTFLIGTSKAAAIRARIIECRLHAGVIEIDAEKQQSLPPGVP